MSRGLGRVQMAILDHLRARGGDDHFGGLGAPLFILEPGIHDMRRVAQEMTSRTGTSAPCLQAAFSRAVRKLVERGHLEPVSIVPISFEKPDKRYSRYVHELDEGAYFLPPSGRGWSRCFMRWPDQHHSHRPHRRNEGTEKGREPEERSSSGRAHLKRHSGARPVPAR